MKKARSISRAVKQSTTDASGGQRPGAPYNKHIGTRGLRSEETSGRQKLQQFLTGMGQSSLDVIHDIQGVDDIEMNISTAANNQSPMVDDGDPSWESVPPTLQDNEDFMLAARDVLDHGYRGRSYRDHRTWRQRIQRLHANWEPRLDEMKHAYLRWKYPFPDDGLPTGCESQDTTYHFAIEVIDIYSLENVTTIKRAEDSKSVAEALASAGYIGSSPENPTLAISIRTLELFRRIKLRKASFSVEAFTKVICDLYNIPYRRRFRTSLSVAFDAYLGVLRRVDSHVAGVLGRNEKDWRVQNACPACCYELIDEPYMKYKRLFAMDANFSLKRVGTREGKNEGDTREFLESDYYLTDEEIKQYEHEVKRHPRGPPVKDVNESMEPSDDGGDGDPVDGREPLPAGTVDCADRWKAAAADERKKMWNVFHESGIFASGCRHGFILWIADLIQSGELAKFPLAVIGKALKVLGDRWASGYDIGCSFAKTIEASSLGKAFLDAGCRCCVNAFHGYSHSYDCQKQNHPNVIDGIGLEDLETMERIFSASNALGGVTRYMSRYRRRVFIDAFFRQWDAEKYANLANMLHNNYVQAIQILEEDVPALEDAKKVLNVSQTDLERWHQEERAYFVTLGAEPEYDVHRVAYVELLQQHRETSAKYQTARSQFLLTTPEEAAGETYESRLSQTRKRETERRHLSERMEQIGWELNELEVKLDIQHRWDPSNPEYQAAVAYSDARQYHRALDRLQKLVIQRLFELHKLNLNYTGYRMRTHIAKALQSRCKAIRNAVNSYNTIAQKMSKPTLDWTRVSHYSFLEEFELLRGTRNDVQDKPWIGALERETMKQDLRIKRAREEVIRCNVEIRRVNTAILDEQRLFDKCLTTLAATHDPIYGAVLEYTQLRQRVNSQLLARFEQTYQLRGFSGSQATGVRKGENGSAAENPDAEMPLTDTSEATELSRDDGDAETNGDDLEDADEESTGRFVALVDYISELPQQN